MEITWDVYKRNFFGWGLKNKKNNSIYLHVEKEGGNPQLPQAQAMRTSQNGMTLLFWKLSKSFPTEVGIQSSLYLQSHTVYV